MVRAKFLVLSSKVLAPTPVGEGEFEPNAIVELGAVKDGSPEDAIFGKYTPAGRIEMQIKNAEAAKFFVPGRKVYVDFSPAE